MLLNAKCYFTISIQNSRSLIDQDSTSVGVLLTVKTYSREDKKIRITLRFEHFIFISQYTVADPHIEVRGEGVAVSFCFPCRLFF